MKMILPLQAHVVLDQLKQAGFEAFVVGGFVRDHILGLESTDIDVSTSASPDQISEVFKALPQSTVGKDHGTIGVKIDHLWIEITSFRLDLEYLQHRKPKGVIFTQDLKEDVLRRDFTINALAMDDQGMILDFVGGIQDLENRCLKTVGIAHERFKEDALRILRALRFAARLDFEIEAETQKALYEDKSLLKKLASERIFDELSKLLEAHKVTRIIQENLEVISEVLPEANRSQHLDKLDRVASSLRWLVLFEGCTIEESLHRLKALKTSNDFMKKIQAGLKCIHEGPFETDIECKLRLNQYGYEAVQNAVDYFIDVKEEALGKTMDELLKSIMDTKACYRLQDLVVKGQDCLKLGYRGAEIKQCLEFLLREVIFNRVENDHKALIQYLKNHLS